MTSHYYPNLNNHIQKHKNCALYINPRKIEKVAGDINVVVSITQGVKESKNQSGQGIMGKRKPHYRGSYIGG